jgi:hypothetical protein
MSAYIYLYQDRIIYWTQQSMFSKPVSIPKVRWYSINGNIPMPFNEMVSRGDISYSLQKGFFNVTEPLPANWNERENIVRQIQLLSALNTVANNHKSTYTDNSVGQPLADALTLDEIREYRATGSIENCTILKSLLETTEAGLSPEALVTKLWLQYESYRTIIAHLNKLEFQLRQLLNDQAFDKATELLNNELDKIRV